MRKISLKYFQKLYNSADELQVCGEWDYFILVKNGKERKLPLSLLKEYEDNILKKYNKNSEKLLVESES